MKAVLAQIAPALGDLDRNLAIHLSEIAKAALSGADLIVFPELSLTGYLLQDLAAEVAQDPASSVHLEKISKASRRIAVVAGFVERAKGAGIYNAAACFLGGKLAHLHRKVYLPTYGMFDEGRDFGAGDVFRTFEAPWGRTGILICEDFWHLSSSYLLSQQGLVVLVVVSNSPTKGVRAISRPPAGAEVWLALAQVVARFLTCFVLYVNRSGYEEGWNYGGGSFAVSPAGELLGPPKPSASGLVPVRLNIGALRSVRSAYPLLRDEKLDLVRRELERIASSRYQEP